MDAICDNDGSMLSPGALAESVRAALASRSPDRSLGAVIDLAMTTAPCDHASITMIGPRRSLDTVAASDDRTGKADLLQYELGEGPCLDAVRTDEILLADDLTGDQRWPRWTPHALGLGFGGVIAVRLFTDTPLGALNLYSDRPRAYDAIDLHAARVVAAHSSVILDHTRTTQDLWRAIDSRNLIGQAQGILMARYRLTPEQALAVLRKCSQTTNVRLTALAEELTRTGQVSGLHPTDLPTSPHA
jgi:hypothetical protein